MSQWPYQTTDVRDQLRVLGLYLAEQIDVLQPSTGRTGQLRGLPYSQPGERPKADVLWHLSEEAQAECAADDDEVESRLLPILYGFEDLASTITLRDGTRIVGAVEIAKLLPYAHKFNFEQAAATLHCISNVSFIRVANPYSYIIDEMYKDDFGFSETSFETAIKVYKWLVAHHFAVDLQPDQYHRKVAR